MGQKKKTKILLIVIIILIMLILAVGGVYAYFVTDLFKSDKEIFMKSVGEVFDSKTGFFDENFKNYIERRKNVPFKNKGDFSLKISGNNIEQFKNVNDLKITFSGEVNNSNDNNMYQNISIDYSKNVKFPINYKKKDNIIGVQIPLVAKKYIAIDIDKDSDVTSEYKQYIDIIKELENAPYLDIKNEKINIVLQKYKDIFVGELKDEYFSQIQRDNLKGIKLSLKNEDINAILVKVLESLKDDQESLDIINEYQSKYGDSKKISISDLEKEIKNIEKSSNIDNENNIEIILFKNSFGISKIEINTDEYKAEISKENYKYNFSVNNDGKQIFQFIMDFDGIQNFQDIKEKFDIKFSLNNDIEYNYLLNNEIDFKEKVNIDSFNTEDCWMLTDYSKESVQNFLGQVGNKIYDINKEQMISLGIEENENPIYQLIPSLGIYALSSDTINTISEEMSELEVSTFNNRFEMYQGTMLSPQIVKGLLSTISLNNEDSEGYKIKEINFEGKEYEASEQNIAFVKSDIDMSKKYKVEFEKEEDTGVIYRVIINAR